MWGRKFQAWAESLSDEEQETLAEWFAPVRGEDVEADWAPVGGNSRRLG
jgi:hypothetical protein